MFVSGGQSDKVHEYSLSTAFDVSTKAQQQMNHTVIYQVMIGLEDILGMLMVQNYLLLITKKEPTKNSRTYSSNCI